MRTRGLLVKMDRSLNRIDASLQAGLAEIREEHRLNRESHEREQLLDRREHVLNRAAVENNSRVMRELLEQRREDRVFLERIEQGIHARTQGLLHVLDELRNGR